MEAIVGWRFPACFAEAEPVRMTGRGLRAARFDLMDITAALDGDPNAYARLVKRYQIPVSKWMWRFTRDPGLLEELVQDVFMQAWVYLPKFKGESAFSTWLFTIATRVGYRHWKRTAKVRINREAAARHLAVVGEMERMAPSEAAEALYGLLQELPPRDRLVLTLLYYEEMNIQEVAEMTGWTKTMVKVQAYRARNKLRKRLRSAGFGGGEHG